MKLSLYADNMILCISSVQFSRSVMSPLSGQIPKSLLFLASAPSPSGTSSRVQISPRPWPASFSLALRGFRDTAAQTRPCCSRIRPHRRTQAPALGCRAGGVREPSKGGGDRQTWTRVVNTHTHTHTHEHSFW